MSNRPQKAERMLHKNQHLIQLLKTKNQHQALLVEIRSLLPAPLGSHCIAASFENGILNLFADSAAWASRLRFHNRVLCGHVLQSGQKVEHLNVRVIPNSAAKTYQRIPRKARPLSSQAVNNILQTADTIEDEELKKALIRLAKKPLR